ncbi:MAG TPA: SIS domain-containing protein, partial [Patescibacteria group bacterium]|nr:SIS domain-containing protein [Patescibacteria group bacterium]
ASWLSGGLPILVGAEFLSANGHIIANQINESAKNFAVPFVIPELNHHLMEGLLLPSAVTSRIRFVFFNSSLYHSENKKRFAITQQVLRRQQIKYMEYTINGSSRLEAALEILLFGSWLSFYLTVINEQNPTDIKWVDYFKAELKK